MCMWDLCDLDLAPDVTPLQPLGEVLHSKQADDLPGTKERHSPHGPLWSGIKSQYITDDI